jgi:hypothetical protein
LAGRVGIDAFELFCAYHLGITADGGYRFQNIHQVAQRFGTNAGVIRQLLGELGMDPDTVVHSSFDMAGAQVDIMLAPEGVSRVELARAFYQDFRQATRRAAQRRRAIVLVRDREHFIPSPVRCSRPTRCASPCGAVAGAGDAGSPMRCCYRAPSRVARAFSPRCTATRFAFSCAM